MSSGSSKSSSASSPSSPSSPSSGSSSLTGCPPCGMCDWAGEITPVSKVHVVTDSGAAAICLDTPPCEYDYIWGCHTCDMSQVNCDLTRDDYSDTCLGYWCSFSNNTGAQFDGDCCVYYAGTCTPSHGEVSLHIYCYEVNYCPGEGSAPCSAPCIVFQGLIHQPTHLVSAAAFSLTILGKYCTHDPVTVPAGSPGACWQSPGDMTVTWAGP